MRAEDVSEAAEVHGCVIHYADLIAHLDGGGVKTITLGSEAEIDAQTPALIAAIRVVLVATLNERIKELEALGVQVRDCNRLISAAMERRKKLLGN